MAAAGDSDEHAPMKLKYMRRIRTIFHFINCWPFRTLGQHVPHMPLRHPWPTMALWYLALISCLLVLKKNIDLSIIEVGEVYITIFLSIIGLYRVFIARLKTIPRLTKDFITVIHLTHFQWKSEKFKKINERVNQICHHLVNLFFFQLISCVLLYGAPACVQNYWTGMYSAARPSNGTYTLPFNVIVPYFNVYTHLPSYIIAHVLQSYLCTDCTIIFLIFEVYLSVIMFHVWGHLKVLIYNLKTFPRPACEQISDQQQGSLKYSSEEEEIVRNMLVEYIKHHQMIVWFTTNLEKAFGSSFAMYYLFQQVSLCITMLACSTLDTPYLIKYGSLTWTMVTQLIMISMIVEVVRSQSELLAESVYSIPWESMGSKNRKIVELFLHYVQKKSFNIKGLGMVPVGANTMVAILKSSLSYFMLLRTFTTEENNK